MVLFATQLDGPSPTAWSYLFLAFIGLTAATAIVAENRMRVTLG